MEPFSYHNTSGWENANELGTATGMIADAFKLIDWHHQNARPGSVSTVITTLDVTLADGCTSNPPARHVRGF